ncbi:MAG: NAD(P)-dependent oxidoreductase [Bacteroidales bacterium]|nr:NAD(P)-dependent oxidoreductase [Bacteroidales bacterium]
MTRKVLLIDTVHRIIPDKLKEAGFVTQECFEAGRDEIKNIICDYCGVVIRSRITFDKEIIDKATNLKFIARVGAGMESIDTDYCATRGITCINSPEGNRDAVGEHAIAMLLNLMNNILKADREVKNGSRKREENRGIELGNKTVAIIGYGNMGSSFAKKLSGFGCNVISYDKYKKGYSDDFTKETDYDEIFERADIVSLHVPLTEETKYLVDSKFLNSFKKEIILINTARGPVVKTVDLVSALKSGKVRAAGLDVIEYEESSFESSTGMIDKEEFKYLASCDNVILTPHIAGWTHESKIKLAEVLVNKILKLKL